MEPREVPEPLLRLVAEVLGALIVGPPFEQGDLEKAAGALIEALQERGVKLTAELDNDLTASERGF